MYLAPDQRALILRRGRVEKLLKAGRVWALPGRSLEISSIYERISLSKIRQESALLNPDFVSETTSYDIGDGCIGILFEAGKFKDVLRSGVHLYWKSAIERSLISVQLDKVLIDPGLDKTLLGRPELADFVSVFFVEPQHKGLLFIDKVFTRILDPGSYYFWKGSSQASVQMVEQRQQQIEVSGQEIMTKEKIPLRVNFFCHYLIQDPVKACLGIEDYEKQFYILVQLALREYIGSLLLDEILERKLELEQYVHEKIAAKAQDFGLKLISSGMKDIILPGEIRDIINQVLVAEKKAQANVITRREETASTRSLLNTAKLLDENKTLYRLKEMEYLERISEKITQLSVGGNAQLLDELKKIFVPNQGEA